MHFFVRQVRVVRVAESEIVITLSKIDLVLEWTGFVVTCHNVTLLSSKLLCFGTS